jgi:hypothetical protein
MLSLKSIARKGLLALCVFGAFLVGSVHAATSNPVAPGATSTGTVDVDIAINPLVWIQRLDGLDAGTYVPGGGGEAAEDDFCVWTNLGTGNFQVTVTSTSTTMTASSGTDTVAYTTLLNLGGTDGSIGTPVVDGDTETGSTGAPGAFPPPSCATDNASVRVEFTEAGNLDGATAGNYTDELQLLVEPN